MPGLDLKKVPRAKRMTALIPRHGRASQDVLNITNPKQGAAMERTTSQEQRKRAASKGKSALAAVLEGVDKQPQPPGGSARERGKYGGRYQKWMGKSVLEIRRANERTTNPRSPLFRRRRLRHEARESLAGNDGSEMAGGMDMGEGGHASLTAVTDRLHDTLSLRQLDHETELMLFTKQKEVAALRKTYDLLRDRGRSLEDKLTWTEKEARKQAENARHHEKAEAEHGPVVAALKKSINDKAVVADCEESYTYVMRLLYNRAKIPLKTLNKRIKGIAKEIRDADHELDTSGRRLHRLEERRDKVLAKKENLESQMAEAKKIYKNKGKKLAAVEKRRQMAEERAIKREKQRQDLHFVLGGDRGEAEEHALKSTLLMRTMKTRAVDARASLMRKQNDELYAAFTKMMKIARDDDIHSITDKFIHRDERASGMEAEEIELASRLERARKRNHELSHTIEDLELEYADPNADRRLQHYVDDGEQRLHNLSHELETQGSRATRPNFFIFS